MKTSFVSYSLAAFWGQKNYTVRVCIVQKIHPGAKSF